MIIVWIIFYRINFINLWLDLFIFLYLDSVLISIFRRFLNNELGEENIKNLSLELNIFSRVFMVAWSLDTCCWILQFYGADNLAYI